MITAIHHVGMSTADMGRCIRFYRDLLGMELLNQSQTENVSAYNAIFGLDNVKAKSAMLRKGNMRLEVWEFERPLGLASDPKQPVNNPRITHICFEVGDIHKEYARLTAAGVYFHCAPQDFQGTKATYGRDPDGNVFEMVEWPSPIR